MVALKNILSACASYIPSLSDIGDTLYEGKGWCENNPAAAWSISALGSAGLGVLLSTSNKTARFAALPFLMAGLSTGAAFRRAGADNAGKGVFATTFGVGGLYGVTSFLSVKKRNEVLHRVQEWAAGVPLDRVENALIPYERAQNIAVAALGTLLVSVFCGSVDFVNE